jgi:quercetin dioxygenase-like cupin family protein
MKTSHINNFTSGWFIGAFKPSLLLTNRFEVGLLKYPKGTKHPVHTHKKATEYNVVVKGSMMIQDKHFQSGSVFVIHPWEIADPEYLEDTEILCVKVPSRPGDKYEIDICE